VKKALLIGLIVCVLAVSGIGAAFATGIASWTNIGVLSRGTVAVPAVGVDTLGYVLSSGINNPAALVGVRLSFNQNLPGSVLFVSARAAGVEQAYFAGVIGPTLEPNTYTFLLYNLSNQQYTPGSGPGSFPDVSVIDTIIVTVAGNSIYYAP
jgi:hypothetical protein